MDKRKSDFYINMLADGGSVLAESRITGGNPYVTALLAAIVLVKNSAILIYDKYTESKERKALEGIEADTYNIMLTAPVLAGMELWKKDKYIKVAVECLKDIDENDSELLTIDGIKTV